MRRRSSEALNRPPPDPGDLRELGERLDEIRRREEEAKRRLPYTAWGVALRLGTEMLAAVVVSVAIGWGLDWAFGTRPVFILVMFVLGGAAGIRNVIVAAKDIHERTLIELARAEENAKED
jgi:ATP synthase protein I